MIHPARALRRLRTLASLALLLEGCQAPPSGASSVPPALPTSLKIDAEVQRLMAQEDVKGLALALIDGGEIVHVAAYGLRSVERGLPLETDSVMYGASLTKAAVAVLALQLVEEGQLELDRPVAEFLPRPLWEYEDHLDLVGDPRCAQLTTRHVLSHGTGFANFCWLEPDEKLRFHRAPGTRYGYSGEGFYVLQTVFEHGLGLDLEVEMRRRLFAPLGMTHTSLQWRADFAANLADGYRLDGSLEPHDERSRASAAGSMDTTISDQARFWAAVMRGECLSPAARAELVSPVLPITSAAQFPTLDEGTDARGPAIGLAAGLGLVVFEDTHGRSWFKGGHNDSTGNMVIGQEHGQRVLVLLSNSVRAERIYPALAHFVLGASHMPWWWEYGPAAGG